MDDEIEIPDWLSKNTIHKLLLEKFTDKKLAVLSFSLKCDIPKGCNNVCDVYRVAVTFVIDDGERTTSMIIKVPKTGGMSEHIMKLGVIKQEENMYEFVLPKIVQIYGENIFTCHCYLSPLENIIVLEDLNALGFKMANRQALLNFEESSLVLKAIARFHAVSVRLHHDDPELIESFKEVLLSEEMMEKNPLYVNDAFQVAAEEFSLRPETVKYSEKYQKYKDRSWRTVADLMKPKKNAFNVLNHGDLWAANILFKYNEKNEPIDVRLIDFQISRFNSPALDLTYFLYCSVKNEVLQSHYDTLLSIYLEELNIALIRCKVDEQLTIQQLEKAMDDFLFYAIYVIISFLPIFLCDPDDALNLKELCEDDFKNDHHVKKYFKSSCFKNVIPMKLKLIETRGGFDK